MPRFLLGIFYIENREDAEDILMDVFSMLMKRPPKHEKNIESNLLKAMMNRA